MFFVAEIGSNWSGDIELGQELIYECAKAGADAVKFQMWKQIDLYPENQDFKQFELSYGDAKQLKRYAGSMGVLFLCSPFYVDAVGLLEKLRVPMYKIAHRTALMKDSNSKAVMEAVAKTGKPVIISYERNDLQFADEFFKHNKIFKLFVKSEYPARPEDYSGWNRGYDGISDHTLGITVALQHAYVNIIEKHVKLESSEGPDAPFSITTQELQDFMILSKSSSLKFE